MRFNVENLIVVGAEINLDFYIAKQNNHLISVLTERNEGCYLS